MREKLLRVGTKDGSETGALGNESRYDKWSNSNVSDKPSEAENRIVTQQESQ